MTQVFSSIYVAESISKEFQENAEWLGIGVDVESAQIICEEIAENTGDVLEWDGNTAETEDRTYRIVETVLSKFERKQ